jgi:hypothetical protein
MIGMPLYLFGFGGSKAIEFPQKVLDRFVVFNLDAVADQSVVERLAI